MHVTSTPSAIAPKPHQLRLSRHMSPANVVTRTKVAKLRRARRLAVGMPIRVSGPRPGSRRLRGAAEPGPRTPGLHAPPLSIRRRPRAP
ncbi:hypothetical protein BC477_19915 [Clavibacter michiganensis subsp. michiganensis]|uniref:Uncharacterized protein n=1 Tax=Clavibacter michiganensis subsp. michiganensis TaxID=33013 RepID=A0A251XDQ1_CLAMM|nr:hypothetical protein BC477_19915 [Clavibacter michiganensis subsp. michiganensis]OUD99956.1 hypothetical protein CMMCAS07_19455 [Clavibacter michiganensis subsp. michiganensis]